MATLSEVCAPPALPLEEQLREMERLHPEFTAVRFCDAVTWTGWVKPFGVSNRYKLRVTYRLDQSPDVEVLEPALKRREPSKAIPHMYRGELLCLFWPHGFEWDPTKLIATTIVPWATFWLLHYEVWLVTGEWLGGGKHPRGRGEP